MGSAFAGVVGLASTTTPWVAALGALLLACLLFTDRGVAAARRVKRNSQRVWVRARGRLKRRLAGRGRRPGRVQAQASPYVVGNGRVARVDAARASRSASVVPWAVEIEISGASIDAGALVRLEKAFKRDVRHFEADCALWSQLLAVQGVVESSNDPREVLASALKMVNSAFDKAGIDMDRASEITNVSIRRTRRKPGPDPDSLSQTLLGMASPAARSSSSVETTARTPSHSSSQGPA